MTDISELRRVTNRRGGCKGGLTTNMDVTAVLRRTPHGDDFRWMSAQRIKWKNGPHCCSLFTLFSVTYY
ncbi:hypothetical protein T11_8497 [Trichinella zimbabwensis]|uniref:Uncharacterized protein n=1 Tax=Trichinella zimbabwensis TaxID=268475 RepID=A0A0V1HS07_9BILA|nr:hypothetical protein T11_8497 [Trichinella zimbabwensis]